MSDEERQDTPDDARDVEEPSPSADPSEPPTSGEPSAEEHTAGAEQPAEPAEQPAGAAEPEPQAAAADAAQPPAAEQAEPPAGGERPAEPAEQAASEQADAQQQPTAAGAEAAAEQRRERARRPRGRDGDDAAGEEVVPGAHLEPDLVLEEAQREDDEFGRYAVADEEPAAGAPGEPSEHPQEQPLARTPMDLAADARYRATGKRKTAVARVMLRPGDGSYRVNGRALEEFFPRETLRLTARQPLETTGYAARMDVVATVHGGGVSSQAGAVRHGIARALVEADPNLRGELKRRGFLTRDARVKERKKAGLKKARKRPQFSKR